MNTQLRGAVGVALALSLAACGSDDPDSSEEAAAATDAPASASSEGGTAGSTDAPSTTEEAETDDGGTVTIEHYSGTDEVPVNPETVVVADLGMLLSLDHLGIEADGFAGFGSPLPGDLQAIADVPEQVGTAWEPDYEAINALEPDLIVVATRSSAVYPEMSEIAPTVDLTFDEDVDYLTAFRQRHEQIGQIFGIEDEVDAELAALDDRIEATAAKTADAGNALVLLTAGAEVSAYGAGSRFGVVHDVFGYGVADESLQTEETHGEVVSFEYVADVNADTMFVVDRSAAIGEEADSAAQILDNELVAGTNAWTNERVVYVDGVAWYLAGNSFYGIDGVIADVEASLP